MAVLFFSMDPVNCPVSVCGYLYRPRISGVIDNHFHAIRKVGGNQVYFRILRAALPQSLKSIAAHIQHCINQPLLSFFAKVCASRGVKNHARDCCQNSEIVSNDAFSAPENGISSYNW